MALATATIAHPDRIAIEAVDTVQRRVELVPADLCGQGLPVRKERHGYRGSIQGWELTDFSSYCRALGIELPSSVAPRHAVYSHLFEDGTRAHVPALAIMRGFFWPCSEVLPATFTSQNIDAFAYIGFHDSLPVVEVLDGYEFFRGSDTFSGNDRHLRWLHSSISGRSCAQSVELHAVKGWLGLTLPMGDFDLTLVGKRIDNEFFATGVEVNSVCVPAGDNISGQDEMFYLHRSPKSDAVRRAQATAPVVTASEWRGIDQVLQGAGFQVDHDVLQLIFNRMNEGYWRLAAPGVVAVAGRILRDWASGDVLDLVLDRLDAARRGVFTLSRGRLDALRATAMPRRARADATVAAARVFMDTEFIDRQGSAVLISLALVGEDSSFYGERPPAEIEANVNVGKFIGEQVLPQLDRGVGLQGSVLELAEGIVAWLNSLGRDRVEIHYDFNLDYTLLEQLVAMLPGELRPQIEPVHVGYLREVAAAEAAAEACWAELAEAEGLRRHHALADARALEASFHAVHGR